MGLGHSRHLSRVLRSRDRRWRRDIALRSGRGRRVAAVLAGSHSTSASDCSAGGSGTSNSTSMVRAGRLHRVGRGRRKVRTGCSASRALCHAARRLSSSKVVHSSRRRVWVSAVVRRNRRITDNRRVGSLGGVLDRCLGRPCPPAMVVLLGRRLEESSTGLVGVLALPAPEEESDGSKLTVSRTAVRPGTRTLTIAIPAITPTTIPAMAPPPRPLFLEPELAAPALEVGVAVLAAAEEDSAAASRLHRPLMSKLAGMISELEKWTSRLTHAQCSTSLG